MFIKELNLTLVFLVFFVFGASAQNIRVIDNKGTLQTFNPWRLNGNIGITEPLVPAIYGTSAIGSAQNFLGTTEAKSLVLGTNNIERLRIDGVGRVGIGTATPSNKLEITHGTAGNSGLRFTNLNSASTANTSSNKVLGLNSTGDVILTNVPGTQNIVDFSTVTPTTSGVVFTPNTPADGSVVYQSAIDNSLWTYNGTAYVTYSAPSSTAWFTSGTTNDAGNSKTSNIYRTGRVGIGTNNPTINLDVVGGFNLRNTTGAAGSNYGMEFNTNSNAPRIDWVFNGGYIGQFSSDANNFILNNSKLSSGGFRFTTNPGSGALDRLNILNNGNVGIGTTTPLTKLHIQGIQTTMGANANSTMLRMSRPTWSGFKWGNAAQFNLGTYDDGVSPGNSKSRLDLALTNGNDETTLTNVMTWLANGNVGINNTAPSAPLVVQGVSGTGSLKLIAPVVNSSGDNWWMGFGHGTTSTDANDRARIGVDILSGGAGRLFFTTGISGSQTRAMFIDEDQRVGIGTSTPTGQLEVATNNGLSALIRRGGSAAQTPANLILQKTSGADAATHGALVNGDYVGRILFSASNGAAYPTNGTDIVGYAVGAQSATNNGGGIFFRTVPQNSVAQSVERMRIEHNGNVGIGTTGPNSKFEVISGSTDVARFTTSLTGTNYAGIGIGNGSGGWGKIASGDSKFQIRNFSTDAVIINAELGNGNVGIGTTSPGSRLEVNGSATNTTALNAAAGTTINFASSNLAYTTANPGAFVIQGMKDGGTYTLAVQGTTSGTASFSGSNPSSAAFTFLSVNNGATIAGKQTLYTFIVMGTTVYFYMATGF